MVNLALSWQEAGISAACLAMAAVAARRSGRPALVNAAGFAGETAVVLALFGMWQLAGSFVLIGPEGAIDRGQWIWQAERAVHLPSETVVQLAFLPHPLIVQALNLYYAGLHFVVVIACLILGVRPASPALPAGPDHIGAVHRGGIAGAVRPGGTAPHAPR